MIFWDFLRFFLDVRIFLTIFDNFRIYGFFLWTFWNFWIFLDSLDFFDFFLIFLDFLDCFGFLDFLNFFWIFFGFLLDFFVFFLVSFKVTKVTTKCYHGYYWTPKIAKNGPKQHRKLFFCLKGKKSFGRSLPQELEVGPHSGPYIPVYIIFI